MRQRTMVGIAAAGIAVVGLVAAGAVIAARGGDDAGPTPIPLGGSGNDGGAQAERSAAAADFSAPAGKMMAASLEYTVSGTLDSLDGSARAWRLPPEAAVTEERVVALASALGVAGAVEAVPPDQGNGWRVGSTDGTTPSLWVSRSAMGDWWYSSNVMDPGAFGCAEAKVDPAAPDAAPDADTSARVPQPCPVPTPPQGVPSAAEAEAKARALFTQLGYDLADWTFRVDGDDWGRYVSASRKLDGVSASLLNLSASYGANGRLTGAGGVLGEPERGDEYPRVGTTIGLERLRSGEPIWFGGGWSAAADAVTTDAVAARDAESARAAEIAEASGGSAGSAGANAATPPPETKPGEPTPDVPASSIAVSDPGVATDPAVVTDPALVMPEPEPYIVTFVGVEPSLMPVWAPDGSVWLVPAYAFLTSDGGRYEVIAVHEDYLQQQAPPVTEPPVTEPAPEPVTTVAPVTAPPVSEQPPDTGVTPPPTLVVDPSVPVDQLNCTGPNGEEQVSCLAVDVAARIVGLTEDEALKVAEEGGVAVRVVERDRQQSLITADYSPSRLNLTLEDGAVIAVRIG